MHMSSTLCAIGLTLGTAATAAAQAAPAPPVRPPYGAPVTMAQAHTIATAAQAEMRKNGWRMAIAIVEPSGTLVLFEKGDDTQYASVEIAQAKARSAALFRRATKEIADGLKGGSMGVLSMPNAVAVEGGLVIVVDGKVVGAVGVSGGSSEQDAQAGQAGLTALAGGARSGN